MLTLIGLEVSPAASALLMLGGGLVLVGQGDGVIRLWKDDGTKSEEIVKDTRTGRGGIHSLALMDGVLYIACSSGVIHRAPLTQALARFKEEPKPRRRF